MSTPDFPSLSGQFKNEVHRLRTITTSALHQFELLFQPFIPRHLLAQEDQGAHSRDRCWNLRLVFWSFLWQVAQAGASCREAIRQAQSLCQLQGGRMPPKTTSPYCQARGNLPLERLDDIQRTLCRQSEEGVAQRDLCLLRLCLSSICAVGRWNLPYVILKPLFKWSTSVV